jgi:16S rRNA (adenine1518-N6/adenine1519-N6)-dimethyltransferase
LARWLDPHPLSDVAQRDDEIFDVVDAQDVVVGREQRSVVHAQGLMHRAVHVFVFNRHGDLLLQKRSRLKDTHPGLWDSSASGHLDSGENYEAAAAREVNEELGLRVEELEEIARLPPSEKTGWEHVALFRATGTGKTRPPCSEIECLLSLPVTEVDAWTTRRPEDFASGFLACWQAWKNTR